MLSASFEVLNLLQWYSNDMSSETIWKKTFN